MGFAVFYRSTRPVRPTKTDAIKQAAENLCHGRTWLGCEPVNFYSRQTDGRLVGSSKPNFLPQPMDAASAASSGLPNGTVRDLLDILCQLSRDHRIDWEIGHDFCNGPIGYIRGGVCDDDVLAQIEAFADLSDMFVGELIADLEPQKGEFRASADSDNENDEEEDDDDGPSILSFRPKGE